MNKSTYSINKIDSTKRIILPFVVTKAPLQNHIAYEKKGHWTEKEKLKYVIFLSYFKEKFTSRDKKKRFCRIFKVMSDFIKTRTHNQCRSHHQKMEKQRFQVDTIIKNVVSKYHPRIYQELYERYLIEIENLDIEEYQENKPTKINQSRPNHKQDSNQNGREKYLSKNQKQKLDDQGVQNQGQNPIKNFKTKVEQDAQIYFVEGDCKKKHLRLTQQCEQEQRENVGKQIMMKNQFPPRCFFGSQQDNFLREEVRVNNISRIQDGRQISTIASFSEYFEGLQMRKIEHFNRANYHYNQMQIELNQAAECEREKSLLIEQQTQRLNSIKLYSMGASSFIWGMYDCHKPL